MLTIRGGTRVIADLAQIGYDCEWQVVGADEVGAWHRRKRIWIVAYPRRKYGEGQAVLQKHEKQTRQRYAIKSQRPTKCDRERVVKRTKDVSNTNSERGCSWNTKRKDAENVRELRRSAVTGYWNAEPDVGRVANGIPNRVDRLRGLGNAIVPQVAYEIMKLIDKE
tara:strand:- start:2653 stop:3150 length:498 start_codon:yes stop_codon:yes gene_type:complete